MFRNVIAGVSQESIEVSAVSRAWVNLATRSRIR